MTSDFTKAAGHEDLLTDALNELGYSATRSGSVISFYGHGVSGTYSAGRFNTRGDDFNVDAVKQKFGKHVVKKAAKQFGWKFVEKGNHKYQIIKGQ